MPLERTKTIGMHDLVLSREISSINSSTTMRFTTPIDGYLERLLAVRGGSHDATNALTITTPNGVKVVTMATGGAARDVDVFELGSPTSMFVTAGKEFKVGSAGSPAETTQVNLHMVIKRR